MTRLLFPLALAGALAGCAADRTTYPSLAPRAAEKQGFAEPETTPLVAQPDPSLDAQVTASTAKLDAIAKGFDAGTAKAERATAAAKGQPVGSEAWLTAQTALAGLDDWHAQVSSLLTDLEQLAIGRARELHPTYPTLEALRARAQAEADRESGAIARLQAMLPAA